LYNIKQLVPQEVGVQLIASYQLSAYSPRPHQTISCSFWQESH